MLCEAVHSRNTLNDLPGGQFLYHTRSVLTTAYPHVYAHDLRRIHGANKPPQLMAYLIETFTKAGMTVFDPFAGVGGTLIGAAICETGRRRAIGIEINPKWVAVYQHVVARLASEGLGNLAECSQMYQEECLRWMQRTALEQGACMDCILFDPPYTIHLKQTMSGKAGSTYAADHPNRRTDYDMHSEEEGDIANCSDYGAYLQAMNKVFTHCYTLLRPSRYCLFLIQNTYQEGSYHFVHADLARLAQCVGFVPKGEIIWCPAGKRLRPYGYPTAWVPNPVHTTIVVLQKPKGA